MIDSDQLLSKLEDWYVSQCNGYWEHQYGIKIDCIDNPGWSLFVDLKETPLEEVEMRPHSFENDKGDWMYCKVEDRQFVGVGDPKKLHRIIESFLWFANSKNSSAG